MHTVGIAMLTNAHAKKWCVYVCLCVYVCSRRGNLFTFPAL